MADDAVHEYQALQLPITVNIITQHLGEFTTFTQQLLSQEQARRG